MINTAWTRRSFDSLQKRGQIVSERQGIRFSLPVLFLFLALSLLCLIPWACVSAEDGVGETNAFAVVLGIAQDGGFPQAGCQKPCCESAWRNVDSRKQVASLAIVDPVSNQRWIIDATPSLPAQLHALNQVGKPKAKGPLLDGILLTHAHVGHYGGLLHLGREVMGTNGIKVLAMPRMKVFLETNGPWSQLVDLNQIEIEKIAAGQLLTLNERLSVIPFLVPHRDEFSETVGYQINGPNRRILYLPDIDKWEKWDVKIEDLIEGVDVALLDGTFYAADELPGRDMSEIPHPFIVESISRFKSLPMAERKKVQFIHFNHTNPLLNAESSESQAILSAGHQITQEMDVIGL